MNDLSRGIRLEQSLQTLIKEIPSKNIVELQKRFLGLREQVRMAKGQDIQSVFQIEKMGRHITREQFNSYFQLIKKKQENEHLINITKKGQQIFSNISELINSTNIQIQHENFKKTLELFTQFEDLLTKINNQIPDPNTLKEQFYTKIKDRVKIEREKMEAQSKMLEQILTKNRLPIKKSENKKEGVEKDDRQFILSFLHKQFCLNSLQLYLLGLLERDEEKIESLFFKIFWEKIHKSTTYLFINQSTQVHNIEQPVWLFQYLQQTLNLNFKYFLDHICTEKILRSDILKSLKNYFISVSFKRLIGTLVESRFQADLAQMTPFLLFNFVDEVAQFQENLNFSFGVSANILQPLLVQYNKGYSILNKIFDHQHMWIENKIFEDFLNINYSKINLKNLDSFNIVVNFVNLFQRLYKKFKSIRNQQLRGQIREFYRNKILNLIAHIKTSFDRIYLYSGLPKIDVLVGFKRVENELKSNLGQFISGDRNLEEQIQRQYYGFLQDYFVVCGLEELNPIHKKLHLSLGEIVSKMAGEDQQEQVRLLGAFGKIYQQWARKMENLCQFTAYSDTKIRNIFFTYLQSLTFSPVGFNLYIKIFEPYLRVLFGEQGLRSIVRLLAMEKRDFLEYLESHIGVLSFLNRDEIAKVQKFKLAKLDTH